jgi:glycosyltransferase involved in cell wall biosynthesis
MSVEILLSTYNGAKYLRPQLESLLGQDYLDLKILLRDDGSTDDTLHIVEQFARNHANLRVVTGSNLGFIGSFFKLLELASPDTEYIALCDQDDVWLPNKLSRAIERLKVFSPDLPNLYCSRFIGVDSNLQTIGYSHLPSRGLSFPNALVECAAWGCTSVFNQATRRLLLRESPRQAYSHDWWIYLVVTAFGHVVYDETPSILYRRHDGNASQHTMRTISEWQTMLQRYLKQGKQQRVRKQAEEFHRIYEPLLADEKRTQLTRFLESRGSFWQRLHYALTADVYRQSTRDHLIMKFLSVMNRL